MKTIKNLAVTATFEVELENIDVLEKVYNGLEKIAEKGTSISDSEAYMTKDKEIQEAWEWPSDNIKEGDAYSWEYEIDDLESEAHV